MWPLKQALCRGVAPSCMQCNKTKKNLNIEKNAGSLGVNLWLIAVQLVDKDEIKQAG